MATDVKVKSRTRRFVMYRFFDVTGISGTGVIGEGVEFWDGTVVFRWDGPYQSTSIWASLDALRAVHGHDDATKVVWVD